MSARLPLGALVAACMLSLSATTAIAAETDAADRAKVVELARQLEADPLDADGRDKRQWLTEWLIAVPDLTVTVCNLLGPALGSKTPGAGEIVLQMMYSNAAFQITHPGKANDETATQTAAVEGSLKAYESILKTNPAARQAYLDGLVAQRNAGTLRSFIAKEAPEKCRKGDSG